MERTSKPNRIPRPRRFVGLFALSVLGSLVAWRFVAGRAPRAGSPQPLRVIADEAEHEPEALVPAAVLTDPATPPLAHGKLATASGATSASLVESPPTAGLESSERTVIVSPGRPEVRGRVVDEATGRGVPEFAVWIEGESSDSTAFTDADGAFRIALERAGQDSQDPSPESWRIEVLPRDGWVVREPQRTIHRAAIDARSEVIFEARRWPPLERGQVRGRLIAEDGDFGGDALSLRNALLLELTSMESPSIRFHAELELVEESGGGTSIAFRFEDVPITTYELTLSSLGNFRWEPRSQIVVPPADGIEFLRFDLDGQVPLEFRVTDALTGEAIEDFRVRTVRATESPENGVLLHTGPLDPEGFPLEGAFCWTIDAEGHAPAFGTDADFVLEEGRRVANVALRAGWATRFVVMGGRPHTRLIAGAEIVLDGVRIGRTGADGALIVSLDEKPKSVEVHYLDWHLANEPLGITQGRTAASRGNVTVVLLEE